METKRPTRVTVFALKGWTVKSENGKFFISPTACLTTSTSGVGRIDPSNTRRRR